MTVERADADKSLTAFSEPGAGRADDAGRDDANPRS
jgi:hypothetical protein